MMTPTRWACRRLHVVDRAASRPRSCENCAQAFEHSIARPFGISPQEVPPPVPEETTVAADKPTTSVDDPGPSVANFTVPLRVKMILLDRLAKARAWRV
jgi:hypothetical protein